MRRTRRRRLTKWPPLRTAAPRPGPIGLGLIDLLVADLDLRVGAGRQDLAIRSPRAPARAA
jgi:hypothetical protein